MQTFRKLPKASPKIKAVIPRNQESDGSEIAVTFCEVFEQDYTAQVRHGPNDLF